MAANLLKDEIATAWQSLTDEQRLCWNFYTLSHPELGVRGKRWALYGWQGFYSVNAWLAVLDTSFILDDPPADQTPPVPLPLTPAALAKSLLAFGTVTMQRGYAWIDLFGTLDSDTALIVRQTYSKRISTSQRLPSVRHVTILLPGDTGPINLRVPRGYFATTAGANKYASIKGARANRYRSLPLAQVIWLRISNGQKIFDTVVNPY